MWLRGLLSFLPLRSLLRRARKPLEIQYSTADDTESFASCEYRVLAFYLVKPVKDPQQEVLQHKAWCRSNGLVGRVWVSRDGLNVQLSGLTLACERYADFVARRFASFRRAEPIVCKMDAVPELAFPRLRVKAKKLVSLNEQLLKGGIDMSDRGEDLEPAEWRQKLRGLSRGEPGKLLDVRNDYEWQLGHFTEAQRPKTDELRAMNLVSLSLSSKDKETPLYMYCTGGIRCEYFGAALRRQGFKHVYKLKGGIQHYGNTIGSEGWKGRLFVFDRRNSVPVGEGAAKLQHCSMCGQSNPAEEFWNCANVDCNRCMVTCRSCLVGANGCCCKECREATRQLSKAIWKIGGTSAFNAMQVSC